MADLNVLFVQPRLCSRAWKEARALVDEGVTVSLVELAQSSPIMDYSIFAEHENLPHSPDILAILGNRRRILSTMRERIATLEPDLVHTHNTPDCFGAWLPRWSKRPVLHDIHDLATATPTRWPETARFHRLKGRVFDVLMNRWEHHACRRTAGVLTTSPAMAALIKERHGPRNVLALENKPIRQEYRLLPKLSATDGHRHVAYAGGITVDSGTERDLLPVFERMTDDGLHVHLYLVSYNEAIRRHVRRRCETNPRLHLHEPVPQTRFIEEMSQYDGGVIWFTEINQNIRVTTQNKLYEFQVAGVPIITNMTDGYTPEHIRERGCGVIVKGPEEVASALAEAPPVTTDPESCFMHGRDILSFYEGVLAEQ